ncbi:MAG: hypothetical protein KDA45_00135 [Planctomycetales bacterium]|nr:hypothetical protein [Planctomycetales bacterium]
MNGLFRPQPAAGARAWEERQSAAMRRGLLLALLLTLLPLLLAGCGSWIPETVPFGAVTAPDHNRSLNGLGAHRKLWEAAGAKCLTPQRLSPKLESMDVIVLVGQTFQPPGRAARDWLEQWLAAQPGRSVIYFGRDFNADVYFRQRTLEQLPQAQRERGEELLALREVREWTERLRQLDESSYCGWFYMQLNHRPAQYTTFSGPWAARLDPGKGYWPLRIALQPPDQGPWPPPSGLAKGKAVDTFTALDDMNEDPQALLRRSVWSPDEWNSLEQWEAAMARVPQSKVLLSGDDGQALAFRLTSDRFPDSQILIVGNGAPLLNGSLVDSLHQQIGVQLVEACLPAQRVALLAYDEQGLGISTAPEREARAAGLEMLTVWPLSGMTMPAALLGIIVCAALLPILGRPQPLRQRSVSDFGLHVEALGHMLYETRDQEFAQAAIAEYFRKVRGEAPPSWLQTPQTAEASDETGRDAAAKAATTASSATPPPAQSESQSPSPSRRDPTRR